MLHDNNIIIYNLYILYSITTNRFHPNAAVHAVTAMWPKKKHHERCLTRLSQNIITSIIIIMIVYFRQR